MLANAARRRASSRCQQHTVESLEPRTFLSAGALDPTFGAGGVVFPSGFNFPAVSSATAVGLAPDGKLVLTGVARSDASDTTAVVARFNPDGTLDPAFGTGGKVILPPAVRATDDGNAGAALVQPDGKVLVAAGTQVVRLNADGSLDTTFSNGGVRAIDVGEGVITEMLLQPDGKLLIAGGLLSLHITRLTPNGFLDSSFNGGGANVVNTTSGRFDIEEVANDLALSPDGKVLVAMTGDPRGATRHGVLVRFNANGAVDTTFDDDGIVEIPGAIPGDASASPQSSAYAVRPLDGGKVAVAGTTNDGFFFAHFRADGRTDPTYGTGGYVFRADPSPAPAGALTAFAVREMEYAPDGKLLAAGPTSALPYPNVVVRRFVDDGSPDTAFGTGGEARTPFTGAPSVSDLAVAADGSVAVAVPENGPAQLSAARYTPQGQPTPALDGGRVSTTFALPASAPHFNAVAEAAGGKIVAAGSMSSFIGNTLAVIARFNIDGSLDTSFHGRGWATLSVPQWQSSTITEIVVLPDGDILAAGNAYNAQGSDRTPLLTRFNANGVRDADFGVFGIVATRLTPSGAVDVSDLAVDSAGRILIAGTYTPAGGASQFALARYTPAGVPDTTFDGDGIALTNVSIFGDSASTVAVLGDGGILVGGTNSQWNWIFVKYRPDGSLDPAFGDRPGDAGIVYASIGDGSQFVTDVVPREGGGFYATGAATFRRPGAAPEWIDFAVAAFNADGSLDTSFGGGDGIATAGFIDDATVTPTVPLRLARGPDGRLTVAGYVTTTGDIDIGLARFTATGERDTTFGDDGRVITDLDDQDAPTDMALLSDGRIVISGSTASNGQSQRPLLARYLGDDDIPLDKPWVYVLGSDWSSSFKTYLEARGKGDDVLGYRVDNLPPGNGSILPWINLNEVVVRYARPPQGSGIPTPGIIRLDGVRSDYVVTSVTALNPLTYVLRAERSLGNLPIPPGGENGDRIRLTIPSGGFGGPGIDLTLLVLQGDADRSGAVLAADFSDVKARFFHSTANPGPAGNTQYSLFADVDGDGAVLAADFSAVKKRFFDNLPPATTAPFGATWSIASALFESRPLLA